MVRSVGVVGMKPSSELHQSSVAGWGLCPWGTYEPDINLVKNMYKNVYFSKLRVHYHSC